MGFVKVKNGEQKTYRYKFLEKYVLGQSTNFNNPHEVINQCIRRAYKDMLSAGRYYINKSHNEYICEKFKILLESKKFIFSRDLIDEVCGLFGEQEKIKYNEKFVTRFGLSQKFVNMTYKYLYVFNDYTQLNIDFSNCDCPLDSVILKKLDYKEKVWSKLNQEDYIKVQNIISKKLEKENLSIELKEISNLAYDFINW